jgi:hypothetical protein
MSGRSGQSVPETFYERRKQVMRMGLQSVSDRLLNMVAPKAVASAISCWQRDGCFKNYCGRGRNGLYEVDPCNDRQRITCGGC